MYYLAQINISNLPRRHKFCESRITRRTLILIATTRHKKLDSELHSFFNNKNTWCLGVEKYSCKKAGFVGTAHSEEL